MVNMFIIAFILFFGEVKPQSEDFVFPLEKSDYFTGCTFINGTSGQCINLSECPNARNEYLMGVRPTMCRFDKAEPVVCCMQPVEQVKTSDNLLERRKSVCEDVYSLQVPIKWKPGEFHVAVVGGSVTSEGEFPHMVIPESIEILM